jgi:hypothetical protein
MTPWMTWNDMIGNNVKNSLKKTLPASSVKFLDHMSDELMSEKEPVYSLTSEQLL